MSHAARIVKPFLPVAGILLVALAACGGGGGSSVSPSNPAPLPASSTTPAPGGSNAPSASPSPGGSPSPTPSSSGAAVIVSLTALSFTPASFPATGQTIAVAQAQNANGFTLSTTNCAGIATAAPATGAGPFLVVPLGAGTCAYVVTGDGGSSSTFSITVTTTTIGNN